MMMMHVPARRQQLLFLLLLFLVFPEALPSYGEQWDKVTKLQLLFFKRNKYRPSYLLAIYFI